MEKDDYYSKGSRTTLSAVKASPRQRRELGSEMILSPIRYSARIQQKKEGNVTTPDSSKIKQYLQQSGYSYAPNKFVKEGFHFETREHKAEENIECDEERNESSRQCPNSKTYSFN